LKKQLTIDKVGGDDWVLIKRIF